MIILPNQTHIQDFKCKNIVRTFVVPYLQLRCLLYLFPYLLLFQFPKMEPSTEFKSFFMESNSQIVIGDFDGDSRMDVMCRMDQGQNYKIALTDGDGFLVNVDYEFGQR